jgi:Fe-S-cluster containining protein
VDIDILSLRSVEHDCNGCASGELCCCSTYEVCVTIAEMRRIIRVMSEVVKFCPHLETDDGFDNVFEYVEPGLYAIDTTEDGLCLFAYAAQRKIQCALHTVGIKRGIPLSEVKPKACLLWPMTFSEGAEALSLTEDALRFHCTALKRKGSNSISSSFAEAIEQVYGEGCGRLVERAAGKGTKLLRLARRR